MSTQSTQGVRPGWTVWTWLALLISVGGTTGSLWLSIEMELIACPLCFYQRTMMLAVTGALVMGLFFSAARPSLYCLPLTVAGLGLAGMHVYKESNGDLECPTGVLCQAYQNMNELDQCPEEFKEFMTPPKESLAIFFLLFICQSLDVRRRHPEDRSGLWPFLGSIILGGGLTFLMLWSVAKHRDIPKPPLPIEGCRKPAAKK